MAWGQIASMLKAPKSQEKAGGEVTFTSHTVSKSVPSYISSRAQRASCQSPLILIIKMHELKKFCRIFIEGTNKW